ncbi:GntR family transcriptional regulator [Actinophytocola sp.]|uniref:GntR family transcriptional regulator n=1 Tax=Actinophytocola sp. TaxID=1872138 RepID=UPI003D6A7E92
MQYAPQGDNKGPAALIQLMEKPQSLTEVVYETIRGAIIDKTLEPGGRVSEARIASWLGVSKTPVREALLRLQVIGLVEFDGKRGARVVRPSRKAIVEAYGVRAALEAATSRHAVEQATKEDVDQLQAAADDALVNAQAGDAEGFRAADWTFHNTLAQASGNSQLTELTRNFLVLTSVLRQRDVPDGGDSIQCAHQHIDILKAIRQGDPDRAAAAATQHIDFVLGKVLAAADATNIYSTDRDSKGM